MYDLAMRFLSASLLIAVPLVAQDQPKRPPAPNPTNLKVRTVKTGAEVSQIMRTFTTGLGVQCVYCHVQGNFASDENPKKEIARHMIEMTKLVNAQFPDTT